jgi:hypothetical protein
MIRILYGILEGFMASFLVLAGTACRLLCNMKTQMILMLSQGVCDGTAVCENY